MAENKNFHAHAWRDIVSDIELSYLANAETTAWNLGKKGEIEEKP